VLAAGLGADGAPFLDGYLYVYGPRSGTSTQPWVVARVLPALIAKFSAYRLRDGTAWAADLRRAVTISAGMSSGVSGQPLPDGRFLRVHMTDLRGRTVAVRDGTSPVGPLGRRHLPAALPAPAAAWRGE
jgi:hypothetical protein